jgi:hypothetical protein
MQQLGCADFVGPDDLRRQNLDIAILMRAPGNHLVFLIF